MRDVRGFFSIACQVLIKNILGSTCTSALQFYCRRWHGPAQGRLNNYKNKPGATLGVGAWCADKTDGFRYRYLQVMKGPGFWVTCLRKRVTNKTNIRIAEPCNMLMFTQSARADCNFLKYGQLVFGFSAQLIKVKHQLSRQLS